MQPKKTIIVTANTSWYLFNFRLNLMKELSYAGYHVIALAPVDDFSNRLQLHGIQHVPYFLDRRGKNPLIELSSLFRLYRIILKLRPSLILSSTPKTNIYSSIISRIIGIPVLCNVSGLGYAFIRQGVPKFDTFKHVKHA